MRTNYRKWIHGLAIVAMLLGIFKLTLPARAYAESLTHEGNIIPSAPTTSTTSVEFWVSTQYEYVDTIKLFFTINGNVPTLASNGRDANTSTGTQTISFVCSHKETGGSSGTPCNQAANGDLVWWKATYTPSGWSVGTVFRYKIGAWHSGDSGNNRYADSTSEWPISDPTKANIFGFRVTDSQQNTLPSSIATDVIYNVFVDRFWDGNTANNYYCALGTNGYCDHDAVDDGGFLGTPTYPQNDYRYTFNGGDIQGIQEKLPYLKDLGVTMLWLSPVFDTPNYHVASTYNSDGKIYMDYHGYTISNPLAVEEAFGTTADLTNLVNAAHSNGMKVILDFVPNHASNLSAEFKDASTNCSSSPYYSWFTFFSCTTGQPTTFNVNFPSGFQFPSVHSNTYQAYGSNDNYRTFFGTAEQVQIFNDNTIDNSVGRNAREWTIDETALNWLNSLGIDGYRLDYVPGPKSDYWREFNGKLSTQHFTIAEIWDGMQQEYIRRLAGRIDSAMDFDSNAAMVSFFTGGGSVTNLNSTLTTMASLFYRDGIDSTEFVRGIFLDNHDMNRFAFLAGGDLATMKLGALLMFTQPGVPIVYYGDEVGLRQKMDYVQYDGADRYTFSEYVRERYPWGNSAGGGEWAAVDFTQPNYELLAYYKQIIHLRKNLPALSNLNTIKTLRVHDGDRFYAYLRGSGASSAVVAFNHGGGTVSHQIPDMAWGNTLPWTTTTLYDHVNIGNTYNVIGGSFSLSLAPGQGVILVNTPPVPAITRLDPDSVVSDQNATIHVYGANFGSSSKVRWNGSDTNVTTQFVNSTELIATVNKSVVTGSSANITVYTPTPVNTTSSAVSITIIPASTLPTLSISASQTTVTEEEMDIVFTIALDEVATQDVTVNYATQDDTASSIEGDYIAATGVATIPQGDLSTTFSVSIKEDSVEETTPETFNVVLSGPDGAILGENSEVVITIEDDGDTPLRTAIVTFQLSMSGQPPRMVVRINSDSPELNDQRLRHSDGVWTVTVILPKNATQTTYYTYSYTRGIGANAETETVTHTCIIFPSDDRVICQDLWNVPE